MADDDGMEILKQIIHNRRASQREAMSMAAVGAFVEDQQLLTHNTHRMNAQVDAALKAKYAGCGMPDAYQPPEPAEAGDMATMINCTFNGDESVKQISSIIGDKGDGSEAAQPKPDQGQNVVVPPPPPPKPNGLAKVLIPLAAVALGSAITVVAGNYFGGKDTDTQYELIALPYETPKE